MQAPSPITACAIVALAAHAQCVGLLILGRAASIRGDILGAQLAKLLRSDNAPRAVKLCSFAGANPAARFALFLLGLELPATVLTGESTDYRAAPSVSPFAERVRAQADAEIARAGRALLPSAIAAVASGLVAAALGLWSLTSAHDGWLPGALTAAAAGAIGAAYCASAARRLLTGPAAIAAQVLELLRPAEEMTPQAREAATAARELLAAPQGPRVRAALLIAAIAAALIAPGVITWIAHGGGADPPAVARVEVARVAAIDGTAPVEVGDACRVTTLAVDDGSRFDCRVQVTCRDVGLYGTEPNMGFTHCSFEAGIAQTALDDAWDEGDPMLRLDRAGGTVDVRTGSWGVKLSLRDGR